MKPYTYLLHHKPTDTFYYGVRWAKKCHPQEFWKKYFTSSSQVALLRTLFGDESFEFEIRRTFDIGEKAADWENKVLRRMKVLQNQDVWLNRTTNKAIANDKAFRWTGQKRPNHSEFMRKMLSDPNKNPCKIGTKWINNGVKNMKVNDKSNLPEGYIFGFLNPRWSI